MKIEETNETSYILETIKIATKHADNIASRSSLIDRYKKYKEISIFRHLIGSIDVA